MLLNIAWIVVPNLSCALLYFGITRLGLFEPAWGIPPGLGFLLAASLCLALTFSLVQLLPPYLGGIFVLGMRAATLNDVLERSIQEFDANATYTKDTWHSTSLDLRVKVLSGFGRMHSRISLRGKDAKMAYEELMPILKWNLEEVVPSRMDRLWQQWNRVMMFVVLAGTLIGVAGWLAGYDLYNFYTD